MTNTNTILYFFTELYWYCYCTLLLTENQANYSCSFHIMQCNAMLPFNFNMVIWFYRNIGEAQNILCWALSERLCRGLQGGVMSNIIVGRGPCAKQAEKHRPWLRHHRCQSSSIKVEAVAQSAQLRMHQRYSREACSLKCKMPRQLIPIDRQEALDPAG